MSMSMRDLKPAGSFAQMYGVKMLGYGPPGEGKTPLINTAPRPVLAFVEPGMTSMRGSNVPTFDATSVARCEDFFQWVFNSAEVKNFDTICVDSVSQMAEMYLKHYKAKNKDGRKAYGEMATAVMEHLAGLFYFRQKHIYLIGKQSMKDNGENSEAKPYFPGQELDVQVPHLYDVIAHICKTQVPGMTDPTLAIRCKGTFNIRARDRSGKLADLEPPHLGNVFAKCMG